MATARRNGAKSIGPITPAGKAKSALNALKHGLAADPEIVLGSENSDNYDRLLEAYMDTYQPASGDEYDLVCQVVSASWRLRRIGRMEVSLLEDQMETSAELLHGLNKESSDAVLEAKAFRNLTYPGRSVDLIIRYTAMARRCFDTALKTLRDLQRERRKMEKQNEPDCAKVPAKSTHSRPPLAVACADAQPRPKSVTIFPAPTGISHFLAAPIPDPPEHPVQKDPDVKIKQ